MENAFKCISRLKKLWIQQCVQYHSMFNNHRIYSNAFDSISKRFFKRDFKIITLNRHLYAKLKDMKIHLLLLLCKELLDSLNRVNTQRRCNVLCIITYSLECKKTKLLFTMQENVVIVRLFKRHTSQQMQKSVNYTNQIKNKCNIIYVCILLRTQSKKKKQIPFLCT